MALLFSVLIEAGLDHAGAGGASGLGLAIGPPRAKYGVARA
ncbi:hypothetical protein [Albidovulum aquaemixtae]|nr:hypothetical protein [Defluviimonas aquaemixtae]